MIQTKATIVELDVSELEEILRRVDAKQLQADDFQTIRALIESYDCLTQAVGDKSTTIRRLRQMLFGVKTEKTAAVVGSPLARDEKQAGVSAASGIETRMTPGPGRGCGNHLHRRRGRERIPNAPRPRPRLQWGR